MSESRPAWLVDPEDDPSNLSFGGKSFAEMIDDFKEPTERSAELNNLSPELDEVRVWWAETAFADGLLVVEKYQEYGNTALLEVGHQVAAVAGRKVTDGEAQELGIWFFMVGKMARWKTAILKGERASKDTLDDLAVYATMARRVHEAGSWPGLDGSSETA